MHELSLAESLLPVVLDIAAQHGAPRVTAVTVEAGVLQQIVPDSLRLAFAAVAQGSLAEGAELRVETVPARAACRRCGAGFVVDDFCFVCPTCGVADVATVAGQELLLTAVELEE